MDFSFERRSRLNWPAGWARTQHRKRASFDMSLERAAASVRDEVRMLGATEGLLTHDAFRNGSPPRDPGAAVYFTLKNGDRKVFACDRWETVRDNVRAIALTIGALRGIGRWGASDMMDRAFTGFDALPAPPNCWEVLGVSSKASRGEIEAVYRRLARENHPDRGGSARKMAEINAARDDALRNAGD